MAKEAKQAIQQATVAPQAISQVQQVPDYLAKTSQAPRGGENLEAGDFLMPRLSICSKQSPQFDENNERYIAGLKLGDFFNSVTREIFGSSIYVVPLFETKTRSRNREYGDDGPPYCVSGDGKTGEGDPGGTCQSCSMRLFTKKANGDSAAPLCTESMNYAVMLMPGADVPKTNGGPTVWTESPRVDTVSIIAFKRTSIGSAKNWNTLLRIRNRDWFAGVYKMNTVSQTDGKNSWHIPIVENAGWLSESNYKEIATPAYGQFNQIFISGRARVDEFEREPGDDLPD